MPVDMDVRGLIETQEKMEQVIKGLNGAPILRAYQRATLLVQRTAKQLAPVDTGQLRASITPDVRQSWNRVQGVVGTNVVHGPFMELGTRPHWPPLAALATWARRHGTTAFVVARAIARKGLKARRYLQRAVEQNATAIQNIIGDGVAKILDE